ARLRTQDMDTPAPRTREPASLIGALTIAVAALWIFGAIATAFAMIGPARLGQASLTEMFALGAAILLPALMALFSGAAVRESVRARAEARRLADAADRLLNPSQSAEDGARKLALSVRGEISTLDNALEQTIARLQEVEGLIQ